MVLLGFLVLTMQLQAADQEEVSFYPTYGYREHDRWVIPMRLWVHEPRAITEALLVRWVGNGGQHGAEEMVCFRDRATDLIADDESGERVRFVFDNDPAATEYMLRDAQGEPLQSDLNGLLTGYIRLTDAEAGALLEAQGSTQGWLRFHAVSEGHHGSGVLRLVPEMGLSVISDIDDTIKITGIPYGRQVVLQNTFFRPFEPASGMAARYRALGGGTVFHYVSGGPWQLYRPLADFMEEAGFPAGSIHMKSVRKNLLTPGSWQDLAALAVGGATRAQKIAQISELFERFPQRRFILIGDSGEEDPEIYRELRTRYPVQVQEIWIRDLVDARQHDPMRLEGVSVITPD